MRLIKNFESLASNKNRQIALDILESGLEAIQPEVAIAQNIRRREDKLGINNKEYDLNKYGRVFLLGFGKGSAAICQIVEELLGERLTGGFVIDTMEKVFRKLEFSLGTHPLPSKTNLEFTDKVLAEWKELKENDLVLVVICGGGSALFESPEVLTLPQLEEVSSKLIKSGADIGEINIVRKHLSKVKGGGLAKHLFPAQIVGLVFSDVPGNDLSVIASGPTTKDKTTKFDAESVLEKYGITKKLIPDEALVDLPQDEKYFEKVDNHIILSNVTCLEAMKRRANELGYEANILSDRIQGNALLLGHRVLDKTPKGEILLVGGESTIQVTGNGKGGRNQTIVLAATPHLDDNDLLLAIDTDGIDYYHFAGALADKETIEKADKASLDVTQILRENNSYAYFEKTGDGILTDKLESNLADIIMVLKI